LISLGHEVRLIPTQYVRPFRRGGKNDANDAEAICDALSRIALRRRAAAVTKSETSDTRIVVSRSERPNR
jgi:transposase